MLRVASITVAVTMLGSLVSAQDAGRGARGGGLANKVPELAAGAFTASSTVAHTRFQHEWLDIPFGGGRLHTWIEFPADTGKAAATVQK